MKRLIHIDLIRGFAMFFMIMTHTNAYFLSDKTSFFLWDFAGFSVQTFVFCSSYLFFAKPFAFSKKTYLSYIKKRIKRLLHPYYIFVILAIIIFLFRDPQKVTSSYILNSFLVTGGEDMSWLILLFLQFTLLLPILSFFEQKKKLFFYGLLVISAITALLLQFYTFPFNYKLIMWLPWLLPAYLGYFLQKSPSTKRLALVFIVLLITTNMLKHVQIAQNHSLLFYDNKYPPNFYFLLYGIVVTMGLYEIARREWFPKLITPLLSYLSKYSFSLYFIHFLILYTFTIFVDHTKLTWWSFFLIILSLALITQYIFNKSKQHVTTPL